MKLLALVLGQRGEVDRRQHLADLHRRAAHLAELLDELARERGGALAGRRVRALGRAHDVGGAGPDPAGRLAGDEPAEAGGARDAGGGGLARLGIAPSVRRSGSRGPYGYPANRVALRAVIRAFGPGRVNLIGEHTDYNGGPRAAVRDRPRRHRRGGAARRRRDRTPRRATSASTTRFAAADAGARRRLARVRARHGRRAARGRRRRAGRAARVRRRRPAGSGLSSSAALEAALSLALLAVAGAPEPDRVELAKLCSRVENDWVGAETGLLDQLASLCGRDGEALRIDFATLGVTPVPLDLGDWRSSRSTPAPSTSTPPAATTSAAPSAAPPARRSASSTLSEADPDAAAALPDAARPPRAPRPDRERPRRRDGRRAARRRPGGGRAPARRVATRACATTTRPASRRSRTTVRALKDAGAAGARMVGGGFGGSVLALLRPGARRPGRRPGRPARAPRRPALTPTRPAPRRAGG